MCLYLIYPTISIYIVKEPVATYRPVLTDGIAMNMLVACHEPEVCPRTIRRFAPQVRGTHHSLVACHEPERSEWFVVEMIGFEPTT